MEYTHKRINPAEMHNPVGNPCREGQSNDKTLPGRGSK